MTFRRIFLPLLLAGAQLQAQTSWHDRFVHGLPLLGQHNWIVVADPAYPFPNSSGIEVVATDLSQTDLLTSVLDALAHATHVRPAFFTDSELPFVAEQDANGIGSYRAQLATLLKGGEVASMPADQMMSKLEDVSHTYRVLVLKSTTLLPYTAVFIRLDSGYWSADAEKRLRAAMQPK